VTRPEPDNRATASLLLKAGFKVELLPVMSLEILDFELPKAGDFAAIAVTSANTLRVLEQKGMLEGLRQIPLFAVGEKTAERAKAVGFAKVAAANGNLVSLAGLIKSQMRPGGKLFYPAARHLSGDLGAMLCEHGIIVKTVPVYQMAALKQPSRSQREMLENGSIDAGVFYSRRSAEIFVQLCASSGIDAARLPVLCLSQNVAEIFRAFTYPVRQTSAQ